MSKAAPLARSVTLKKGMAAPASGDTPVAARALTSTSDLTATSKAGDLAQLAFKVPVAFNKEFRQAALDADMKLNELLFAAFSAYKKARDARQ